MLLLHYGRFLASRLFLSVRDHPTWLCELSHKQGKNIPPITYIYSPKTIEEIYNILIYKDFINNKRHYLIKFLK